jgi:hypothetical protein
MVTAARVLQGKNHGHDGDQKTQHDEDLHRNLL